MRISWLSPFLTLAFAVSPALAEELAGIGKVLEIGLLPFGHERCPDSCRAENNCFSNGCGCGEAKIQIERVLVGSKVSSVIAKYPLGEWCSSVFEPHNSKILFRLADNQAPQWSPIYTQKDGVAEFLAESFTVIGNVKISTIAEKDGTVTVNRLSRELASNFSSKPTP